MIKKQGSMFFRKKKSVDNFCDIPELIFKGGESFFEYQCEYGHTEIKANKQAIVGLILQPNYLTEVAIQENMNNQNENQMAIVKVASKDGGFISMSQTPLNSKGDKLKHGDIVLWLPMKYEEQMALSGKFFHEETDERFGWISFIIAKIEPIIDKTNNFKIIQDYT